MKTLSGGEKSYSTISLVLALWSQIQPPFRILDEFDVFMDSLNRRIALDQIINYAKVCGKIWIPSANRVCIGTDEMLTHFFFHFQETRKFQYLFLTPLSLENLSEEKEDVNVVYFKKNEGWWIIFFRLRFLIYLKNQTKYTLSYLWFARSNEYDE